MGLRNIHTKSSRLGFSMVEMLVAMSILVTVISGVVLLYIGAVNTVRTGYKAIDNFEIGRSTLAAIERDLERSFTARQYGQFFQFHGGPEAMMYVGVLEDGALGRITYAVNRLDGNNDFTMQDTQSLRTVIDRAITYVSKERVGFPGSTEAAVFARRLAELFAADGYITVGALPQDEIIRLLPAAVDFAVAEALFDLNECQTNDEPYCDWKLGRLRAEDPLGSGNFVSFEDATLELEINVQTAYMLRYEEPAVTNLNAFDLPLNLDDDTGSTKLQFPIIDPASINGIRNLPAFNILANCEEVGGSIENFVGLRQERLNCYIYQAIKMPETGDAYDLDLRQLAIGATTINPGQPASYITPKVIDRIFECAKRDVWLELFTGTQTAIDLFSTNNTLVNNYFEAKGLDPKDYVIAEHLVVGGRAVSYNLPERGTSPEDDLFLDQFLDFDILGIGAFFTYADTDGTYMETYNALDNVPGYQDYSNPLAYDPATNLDSFDRFLAFDTALGEEMRGTLTEQSQGSPIAPRIPALVSPRFWIMTEGATLNDPPFKRYFDQVVDVPSSTRRTLPKQFVPDAG